MIAVQDAWFTWPGGAEALRGVDLHLAAGERVVLAGPNGAGKTTLARLLNGLLVPTRGTVRVQGVDTAAVPPSRVAPAVGYVFQNPRRQVFASTVEDEVAFGPRNLGWSGERVGDAVARALDLVDLGGHLRAHPYELGASELRRVTLASVLAMETPAVILDEPTAALDGADHLRLLRCLQHLESRGALVVAITHDMDFAAEHFGRLVVLREGRVEADGPPDRVFGGPVPPELERPAAARVAEALGLPPAVRGAELLDHLAARA